MDVLIFRIQQLTSHPTSTILSIILDLEKITQRFLRKPVRVSLATLLGVYRAVMRLTSVTDALDEAIGSNRKERTEVEGASGAQVPEDEGGQLIRQKIITPLREVGKLIDSMQRCYVAPYPGSLS